MPGELAPGPTEATTDKRIYRHADQGYQVGSCSDVGGARLFVDRLQHRLGLEEANVDGMASLDSMELVELGHQGNGNEPGHQ